jgi:hypothetical protein
VLPLAPCPGEVSLLEHPLRAPLMRTIAVDVSSELRIMNGRKQIPSRVDDDTELLAASPCPPEDRAAPVANTKKCHTIDALSPT